MLPLLIYLLLMSFPGCSGIQTPPAPPSDVRIELDAFSGRPNPEWFLTAGEASALAVHLSDAAPRPLTPLPAQPLGFRGFSISNPDGDGGIRESLYITAAGELVDPVNGSIYADAPDAAAYLRQIAAGHGFGAVVEN